MKTEEQKKIIRRIMDYLYKYATNEQIEVVCSILGIN